MMSVYKRCSRLKVICTRDLLSSSVPSRKDVHEVRLVSENFRIVVYSIYPASRYVSALISRCYNVGRH